jgi:hypothetical protein
VDGQALQTEFGKNIVQYRDFSWAYYQGANFDVYFYEGGREPARFVVENGDKYLHEIEKLLDYQLGEKISFLVYNSFSDYRQSNYHLTPDVNNTGGRTTIEGNKVFVYFSGDHLNFIRQLKAGFAKMVLSDLMSGGSIQDRVQNSVLLNIPEWYTEGLIRYISEGWNPYLDNELKHGIISERFRKMSKLKDEEKELVSQSLWKYVYDIYGEGAFANVVYNTRAARNMEVGFEFALGKNFTEVFADWYDYEFKHFTSIKGESPASFEEIKGGKIFRKGKISRLAINAPGSKAAFVTNDMGKIKLWVLDIESHKRRCIFKSGYRRLGEQDYNYPIMCWNPIQDKLTVFYEKRSELFYIDYDPVKHTKSEPQLITGVDYLLDASYSQDGKVMVTSAMKNGQSDIFIFDPRTQFFHPLTYDIYDDRQPRFVNKSKGIVFTTDRPNTGLNKVTSTGDYHFNDNYNIYYFPDYRARPKSLKKISNTGGDELMPGYYDSTYISYLTDENGVMNRNAAYLDSIFQYTRVVASYKDTSHSNDTMKFYTKNAAGMQVKQSIINSPLLMRLDTDMVYKDTIYTYNITDYNENILSYSISPSYRSIYELYKIEGKYRIFKRPTPAGITSFRKKRLDNTKAGIRATEKKSVLKIDTISVINSNDIPVSAKGPETLVLKPYFQTEFPEEPGEMDSIKKAEEGSPEEEKRNLLFRKKNKKQNKFAAEALYFPSFSPDLIVGQLDNSINTSPYLPYHRGDALIYNPTIQGVFKLGTSDLFKDYRIIGGLGVQPDFSGAEYFLSFENLKNRLDKKYTFYRKSQSQTDAAGSFTRQAYMEGRAELRIPFSEVLSLRNSVFMRQDNTTFLSGDKASLVKGGTLAYRGGLKVELVFDNTIIRGLNIRTGSRYKIYTEAFDAINQKNTIFAVSGGDFRTYTRLSRSLTWANRFSFATSYGSDKVVYFMGGADGWLTPRSANNQPDPAQNYVYMLQPGSLRGFNQNERNGNSFALINSEIRWPIVRYFLNRPLRSQLLENFQVVSFFDAGSAWLGLLPTGENNAYKTRYIYEGPLIIKAVTNRDPFIYGYGFGLRTTLLGYFVKLDYAWGVENNQVLDPATYFSFGLDF